MAQTAGMIASVEDANDDAMLTYQAWQDEVHHRPSFSWERARCTCFRDVSRRRSSGSHGLLRGLCRRIGLLLDLGELVVVQFHACVFGDEDDFVHVVVAFHEVVVPASHGDGCVLDVSELLDIWCVLVRVKSCWWEDVNGKAYEEVVRRSVTTW